MITILTDKMERPTTSFQSHICRSGSVRIVYIFLFC